jgi:signal transduction histidine kinase
MRSTIRLRLALSYSLLFLLTGGALLAVAHTMVRTSLVEEEGTTERRVVESYGYLPEYVEAFYGQPLPTPEELAGQPTNSERLTVGEVILGVQQEIRQAALDRLIFGTSVALVGLVLAAMLFGWLMAGRVLAPVQRLTTTARRISESSLHERIALEGPKDELRELADTLDEMISRLEKAFHSQRRFAADVSHELRTPVAIIRAEADVALGEPSATTRERALAGRVRDAADRCERLIDSLLALSRGESTLQAHDRVDLAELAGDVLGARTSAADKAGVAMDLDLQTAEVQGDRWLLERLVANLVDNGIAYNTTDGWLHVSVQRQNGHSVVRVANSGPPLTSEAAARLFEPFHRGEAREVGAPAGFGLGLTIVRAVTHAHGGEVALQAREGGGLEVTVELPSAAAA